MTVNMSDSVRATHHDRIKGDKECIVYIETSETVDAIDFQLSKEEQNKLYKIGYNSMRSSYLNK